MMYPFLFFEAGTGRAQVSAPGPQLSYADGAFTALSRIFLSENKMPLARITTEMPSPHAGGNFSQPKAHAMKIFDPMKISMNDSAYFRYLNRCAIPLPARNKARAAASTCVQSAGSVPATLALMHAGSHFPQGFGRRLNQGNAGLPADQPRHCDPA